jgi:hypothetical protein
MIDTDTTCVGSLAPRSRSSVGPVVACAAVVVAVDSLCEVAGEEHAAPARMTDTKPIVVLALTWAVSSLE